MIGTCPQCRTVDELIKVQQSAGVALVCEWCAESDRREHDDASHEQSADDDIGQDDMACAMADAMELKR